MQLFPLYSQYDLTLRKYQKKDILEIMPSSKYWNSYIFSNNSQRLVLQYRIAITWKHQTFRDSTD